MCDMNVKNDSISTFKGLKLMEQLIQSAVNNKKKQLIQSLADKQHSVANIFLALYHWDVAIFNMFCFPVMFGKNVSLLLFFIVYLAASSLSLVKAFGSYLVFCHIKVLNV